MTRSVVRSIGWSARVNCSSRGNPGKGCDTELRVTPDDVYWGPLHGREDPDAGSCLIQCPRCGAWTDLHAFMIPDAVLTAARKRGLPDSRDDDFPPQRKAA